MRITLLHAYADGGAFDVKLQVESLEELIDLFKYVQGSRTWDRVRQTAAEAEAMAWERDQ